MFRDSKQKIVAALIVLGALLISTPCRAENHKRSKGLWVASVASLVAAHVLDASLSAGRYETNPLLRDSQGRFRVGRAVMIKAAASGGSVLLQTLLARNGRAENIYRPAALINFGCAGVIGGVALSNARVPRYGTTPEYLQPQ
jgi:hypothetical protein